MGEKVIVHERYREDSWHISNDIALIRLAEPAKLSVNVIPVCLPLDKKTTADNLGVSSLDPNTLARELQTQADPVTFQTPREVTVAGWGKTRDRYESQQNKLDVGASSDAL